jgi:hypothetical protein
VSVLIVWPLSGQKMLQQGCWTKGHAEYDFQSITERKSSEIVEIVGTPLVAKEWPQPLVSLPPPNQQAHHMQNHSDSMSSSSNNNNNNADVESLGSLNERFSAAHLPDDVSTLKRSPRPRSPPATSRCAACSRPTSPS